MRKGSKYYEEDYDDGYDDEEEEEDEEEWYAEETAAQPPAAPQHVQRTRVAKTAPSALGKGLTQTPGAGKAEGAKTAQAAALRSAPQPLVPGPAGPFRFDTPSPDDAAREAAARGGARKKPPGGQPPPPAPGPAAKDGTEEVSEALRSKLQLGAAPAEDQATQLPPAPRHALSAYEPSAEVARACAATVAEESAAGAKPRLHLVVLGHVDAGKSTLMGRFLVELGLVPQRVVHKTQREAAAAGKGSFAWAWMLDERPEERARGVTVEVAMTRFETSQRQVTLLDAPGHRDFVPAMIAGAAQADAALLVVDCSVGGFEAGFAPPSGPGSIGGQTREHAQLARSLGISQLAVVGTKLDAISGDPEEQAARFAAVRGSLEPFLKSCGFASRAVQWLPASGVTGDNLRGRGDGTGLGAWWRGGTLEDAIDAFRPGSGGESERERALRLPLRLVVHEAAAAGSKGAAQLGGKLEAGALLPGSRVLVMPSGQAATVRTLGAEGAGGVAAGGSSPAALLAGSGVSLTLAGLDDPGSVGPGSIVCDPAWPVPAASAFRARVLVLQVPGPILPGQQVSVYCHAAKESGTLRRLQQDGPSPRPARFLVSGQRALVEVALARPLALETAADLPALGRVVLRDGGRTLAVGLIIELL
uniref:Tr-type G domain-containing protein n=1 Tax=Auxenochlorella protothecoides TaxID=3075 RepID=A0A1D1ZPH7_AUXPR